MSGPDDGHTFEFSFRLRGSYGVTGEPGHHDCPDWHEPVGLRVRAWSLREALLKAAETPLHAWAWPPD
jgi:hypothetical protein